jgi:hypothetical protein
MAKRAELHSEMRDLHAEIERLHGGGDAAVNPDPGFAESCFRSAQTAVDDLAEARNVVRGVDTQIAALDEWLAAQEAKKVMREAVCVECPGCAKLAARVGDMETTRAEREAHSTAAMDALALSLRRCEQEVGQKSQELTELIEHLRVKVTEAEAARQKWEAATAAQVASAEQQRATVISDLPGLREMVKEQQGRIAAMEDQFHALKSEYRSVGDLSLTVFKTVEDDRKKIQRAVDPWVRDEGGVAMKQAQTRLETVEAAKLEIEAKLENSERRLALAEKAQVPHLEPKIVELEGMLHDIHHKEHELHHLVKKNTTRLEKIEAQCSSVNNWMASLANTENSPFGNGEAHTDSDDSPRKQ